MRTENTCSTSESQSTRDLARQWGCSAWETTHPYGLISWPFQLTSCFTLGCGHHTTSQRPPGRVQGHWFYWVSVTVGQFNCWLWHYFALYMKTVLLSVFSRFSHFHDGFSAASSRQMWIVCPWYVFCWTFLKGFSRPFNSPPDLTPFTLDKHNTKEKNTFYVRRWVITCRKRGLSNSPGRLSTHKSSSNERFLSKQGAKTNWTRSPICPTSPPSLTLFFLFPGWNFYEERRDGVVQD